MDNVKVNFTVPEPGNYTFVVSGPGATPVTNFSITIPSNGAPTVQGPSTEDGVLPPASGVDGRIAAMRSVFLIFVRCKVL